MTERGVVAVVAMVSYFGGLAWLVDNGVPWWFTVLVAIFGSIFGMFCVLAAAVRDLRAVEEEDHGKR